ncbi:Haloacid dehalogenase-like hydrolase domain-containing protein 3 [Psilocybe cubensis]|uniref:Haloacid dehalogenase-like hydrolase domain-containing protein 3 n=2 Tax=Psilocybe cubensis TaxID=181762 RepID=A0ACB8HC71_PSICU|nr:Haloacid dehalogenase-like hydrolase domain-containing protein 3 [Psilocybe cubensis]KAH9485461.1 Haloacid dehalogenase-like hydrolase domain-containing protein 3 [Psilocybe cubensis]
MLRRPKKLVKLVTFDALHTIITPRLPIHEQYSRVFSPYVGDLDPTKIKQSFRVALKCVQKEHPFYNKGAQNWWQDVIRRTAIGAGADEKALDAHLAEITRKLMKRFSSDEGYKVFEDTLTTISRLREQTDIKTAIISNGDTRLRSVLESLNLTTLFDAIILSEEEGVEKPSPKIFERTLQMVNQNIVEHEGSIRPSQCLHVGDELVSDYQGASNVGWHALLLRRTGADGEQEHKEHGEDLKGIQTISSLGGVINWIQTGEV